MTYDPENSLSDESPAALLTLAAVVFVAAIVSIIIASRSARSLETCWDEHTDRQIAVGLAHHPLVGEQPTLDGSQTRLPMYATAAAYWLTGREDLSLARTVSLLFAGVTVIATAALGRRLFGPLVGGLAAILLALSPYFLAYARIAMTEGDIAFACCTTLAAWGLVRYAQRPTPESWLAAAVLAAFAVGAKLFAVVPLALLALVAITGERRTAIDVIGSIAGRRRHLRRLRTLLAAALALIAATMALAWQVHDLAAAGNPDLSHQLELACIVCWLALLILWGGAVFIILYKRLLPTNRPARLIGLIALAAVTFFALMPVHLLAHGIARDILRGLLHGGEQTSAIRWTDHLRLYSGILLIKQTVPLGVIAAAAFAFGLLRSGAAARWRFCALPVLGYVAVLCLLPVRQTFYLMGVYPLLVIMTAAFAVQIGQWLRRSSPPAAVAWAIVVAGLVVQLAWKVQTAYPYYHLYGYDVVGDRWLGAETRGYRNLIQTPSDGVESLIRWCNADTHIAPGSRVVSYLWEGPIIADALPSPPLPYTFIPRGLSPDSDAVPPPPSIEDADYVLLHLNNLLGYGDRPPDRPPEADFPVQFEKVYTVHRGPLEVAWVYARRADARPAAPPPPAARPSRPRKTP